MGLACSGLAIGEEHHIAAGCVDELIHEGLKFLKQLSLGGFGRKDLLGELVSLLTLGKHVLRIQSNGSVRPAFE